jgi:hypothetical protein
MADLYAEDFVRWTEEQASALRQAARSGANLPVDWENVAEEIESLGISQRHELRSRIALVIEHLLKLECSPAKEPRAGWMETIERERAAIERVVEDSPSLRNAVPTLVAAELPRTVKGVGRLLRLHDEASPDVEAKLAAARYTEDQVLGDWFPGEPDA